jgi:Zn-dependent M32 family carboxypeptidase
VRAEQWATLARTARQRLTDPVLVRLLDVLSSDETRNSEDLTRAPTFRLALCERECVQRVPIDLAAELAHASAVGFDT